MSATNCLINVGTLPTPRLQRIGTFCSTSPRHRIEHREDISNCSVTKENVAGKVYSETDEKVWPMEEILEMLHGLLNIKAVHAHDLVRKILACSPAIMCIAP